MYPCSGLHDRYWSRLSLRTVSGHIADLLLHEDRSGYRSCCQRKFNGWDNISHHVLQADQRREPWIWLVSEDFGLHYSGHAAHSGLLDAAKSEATETSISD